MSSEWFVYMLRCADGSLYTGMTTDLQRRLAEHNACNRKGARYTRCRRPVAYAYWQPCANRRDAARREYRLKRLTKKEKEALISRAPVVSSRAMSPEPRDAFNRSKGATLPNGVQSGLRAITTTCSG